MITAIIIIVTILLTLTYIVACMLGTAIFSFRIPILIVIIAFLPIILIKIYIQIKKYGAKNLFRVFGKFSKENEQLNLVEHILNKWDSIHYLYKIKNNMILFLSKSGLYIIKVVDYYGTLSGNELEGKLILKNETTSLVDNFFMQLKELEALFQKVLPQVPIKKIIVSKETCNIGISYSETYLIIGIHNFYCQTKILEKSKFLTDGQVEEVKQVLMTYLKDLL